MFCQQIDESSLEAAKKRAEPYNKIVGELPDMRQRFLTLRKADHSYLLS